jgi:hypothetical protein
MVVKRPHGHKPTGYPIPSDPQNLLRVRHLGRPYPTLHRFPTVCTRCDMCKATAAYVQVGCQHPWAGLGADQSSARVISRPPSMVAARLYKNEPSVASAVKITTSTQAIRAVTPITFWVLMYS